MGCHRQRLVTVKDGHRLSQQRRALIHYLGGPPVSQIGNLELI